ncbi:carboxymuconolactone decarboxylase family protein [Microbaculum marinum]|uniref:Carboxymuconolactone decarboxylase family protein n=1 Tax=Microbaculum marinum TaxID=1764581 RepID=A0AAW9RU56_9HYPH
MARASRTTKTKAAAAKRPAKKTPAGKAKAKAKSGAKSTAPKAAPRAKTTAKATGKPPATRSAAKKTRAQTYVEADPVFAAGLELRHAMWGPGGGEDQINAASDFLLPLQEIVTKYCFGETWTREALSRRDRSLVTLGILVSQARPHELKVHVRGALANGVTKEEIGEVLRHAMVYCGIPRGVEAYRSAAEVLNELGLD